METDRNVLIHADVLAFVQRISVPLHDNPTYVVYIRNVFNWIQIKNDCSSVQSLSIISSTNNNGLFLSIDLTLI